MRHVPLVAACLLSGACSDERATHNGVQAPPSTQPAAASQRPGPPPPAARSVSYFATIVHRLPHDTGVFTEGLELRGDTLYESSGLEGVSFLQRTSFSTGAVLGRIALPDPYFGEGLTIFGTTLYWLTYRSNVGFTYDAETLAPRGTFRFDGEGWGMTHDATSLIMSDGTSVLRYLDPATLQVTRRLAVTDGGRPVDRLNELEWVKGEILANVWQTFRIARIDPASGHVTGWIDIGALLTPAEAEGEIDVANGIAYDEAKDRLFVTGKYWPAMFEIRLTTP